MTSYALPLFLEDKTGLISNTEFADIYDRPPFFQVSQPTSTSHVTNIFELSVFVANYHRLPPPSAILEFGPNNELGMITMRHGSPLPMDRYLPRSERNGSSLSRKFRASDGVEYVWGYRTVSDQLWTCMNAGTLDLVAHYDLKSPGEPAYSTSGNVLTVYEDFQALSLEFLATLVIMRHILQNRL